VLVPVTTVDEYSHLIFSEYYVRLYLPYLAVQSEAVASAVEHLSSQDFRQCIAASNRRYHSATCCFIDNVNHFGSTSQKGTEGLFFNPSVPFYYLPGGWLVAGTTPITEIYKKGALLVNNID